MKWFIKAEEYCHSTDSSTEWDNIYLMCSCCMTIMKDKIIIWR